jgi:hypothetical protein
MNHNITRTIIAGVSVALIVALVMGYTGLHTTITKLTLIAEQTDKRLTLVEQNLRQNEIENTELKILMARQNQLLEMLHEDHKEWSRRGK